MVKVQLDLPAQTEQRDGLEFLCALLIQRWATRLEEDTLTPEELSAILAHQCEPDEKAGANSRCLATGE